MSLENQESKEDERRQEDKKIEGADKLLKQEGKNADIAETAKRAGQNLSKEIENTRLDKAGSSGESEKAEYHRQSLPLLAKYE
ncbi:MAG: hypothetical protein QG650_565 [Patescibacteria group bacterium]|nr:hypothetical protein [Patescibacteria group bacterium]